jgi:rRNA small subunit pseudouridine methyltransferase Nep1
MLHLVIADAELETVPQEIASNRIIARQAHRRGRRPTEILLDSNLHYPAMRGLPDADRRGRPDIVHVCLNAALDTPLNREGLLRLYVHTRQNKLITIDPSARLPRSYNRFTGLIEHLFLTGSAPPENPLLQIQGEALKETIVHIKPGKVMSFSEHGSRKLYGELFHGISMDDEVCVIIGGFPHGDFISRVTDLSDEIVCIDPEQLDAITVLTRAIHSYEDAFEVQKTRFGRVSHAPTDLP